MRTIICAAASRLAPEIVSVAIQFNYQDVIMTFAKESVAAKNCEGTISSGEVDIVIRIYPNILKGIIKTKVWNLLSP